MVISDIVMTIGVGISQKKKMKNLTPVTILWFDPYTNVFTENCNSPSIFASKMFVLRFSQIPFLHHVPSFDGEHRLWHS